MTGLPLQKTMSSPAMYIFVIQFYCSVLVNTESSLFALILNKTKRSISFSGSLCRCQRQWGPWGRGCKRFVGKDQRPTDQVTCLPHSRIFTG